MYIDFDYNKANVEHLEKDAYLYANEIKDMKTVFEDDKFLLRIYFKKTAKAKKAMTYFALKW
jgi:hypothetical protein